MESFNTNLLDELLETQEEIRASNRRLSVTISEALEASSIQTNSIPEGQGGANRGEGTLEKRRATGKTVAPKRKAEDIAGEVSRKSPKAQKMTTMEEKMDILLKRTSTMVSVEDVEKISSRIEGRLLGVEVSQGRMSDRQTAMEARLVRLERDRVN